MSATLIFWRHGQTEYNAEGRLQGQVDIPLNDTGREQAESAAKVLAQTRPVAIITSDLSRAWDTANYLGRESGLALVKDKRLRERSFGEWEGLTHEEIRRGWPAQYERFHRGETPEGVGAERRTHLGQRVARAAAEASNSHDVGQVVVLVAHGTAIGAGVSTLLGQDPERWQAISGVGNCHWSVVQPSTREGGGWRLTAHNCGGALTDFPLDARIV